LNSKILLFKLEKINYSNLFIFVKLNFFYLAKVKEENIIAEEKHLHKLIHHHQSARRIDLEV
jgi:hypothetical protein